jgi:hypothetical protein
LKGGPGGTKKHGGETHVKHKKSEDKMTAESLESELNIP